MRATRRVVQAARVLLDITSVKIRDAPSGPVGDALAVAVLAVAHRLAERDALRLRRRRGGLFDDTHHRDVVDVEHQDDGVVERRLQRHAIRVRDEERAGRTVVPRRNFAGKGDRYVSAGDHPIDDAQRLAGRRRRRHVAQREQAEVDGVAGGGLVARGAHAATADDSGR